MKRLQINLATRPFRNNSLYWAGFGSAAVILAALTVLNGWLFLHSGSSVQQYSQDLVLKQGKRNKLLGEERHLSGRLTKLDFNGLAQQAEFANDAIRRRIFSWTELFNRLEEVVPPAVMLTALRPEIQAEGISIVAEGMAKDQEGLLDFEENLIRSAYFARIYPGSERREQRGGELHFSLKFEYLPGGRPDASPEPAAPARTPPKPAAEVTKTPAPPVPALATAPKPSGNPQTSGAAARERTGTPSPVNLAAGPPAAPMTPVQAPPSPGVGAPGSPQSTATSSGTKPAALPGTKPAIPPGTKRGGTPGRPMLRPGMGRGRTGGGGQEPPDEEDAHLRSEAMAAANFVNRPLEDVIDYLTKNRSMAFVFDGRFDLRQKVTLDVYDKEQVVIIEMLSEKLGAVILMEGENTYRVKPRKPPETLEEPPVEEEPVPDNPPEEKPPKGNGR